MKNGKTTSSNNIDKIRKHKDEIAFVLYPLTLDFNKFYFLISPEVLTRRYKKIKMSYSISLFSGDMINGNLDIAESELPISRYGIFMNDIKVETSDINIFLNALSLVYSVNHINDIINNPFETGTFYILFAIHDIRISIEYMDGSKVKFKSDKLKPYYHPVFGCNEIYEFEAITEPYSSLYNWISDYFGHNDISKRYSFDGAVPTLSIKKNKKWELRAYTGYISNMSDFIEYPYNYFEITPGLFHEVNGSVIPDLLHHMPRSLDVIIFDHEDIELNFNEMNIESIIPDIFEDDMGNLWHLRDYIENISERFFIVFNFTFEMFTEYRNFAQLLLISNYLTMFLEYAARILYGAKNPETLLTLTGKNEIKYSESPEVEELRSLTKPRIVPNTHCVTSSHQIELITMNSKFIRLENFILGCRIGDINNDNLEVYSY